MFLLLAEKLLTHIKQVSWLFQWNNTVSSNKLIIIITVKLLSSTTISQTYPKTNMTLVMCSLFDLHWLLKSSNIYQRDMFFLCLKLFFPSPKFFKQCAFLLKHKNPQGRAKSDDRWISVFGYCLVHLNMVKDWRQMNLHHHCHCQFHFRPHFGMTPNWNILAVSAFWYFILKLHFSK